MSNNWETTPKSDVFRLKEGEVRPLLRDEDGNLLEPIKPGSLEDPFTFRPESINDVLYGLNKVKRELEEDNPAFALELVERCRAALQKIVKAEFESSS